MKLSKNKFFYSLLKKIDPSHTEFRKIKNGYITLLPLKELGYQVMYDIRDDVLLTKKLVKKFMGNYYEETEESKRYRVEIKEDRALLHRIF